MENMVGYEIKTLDNMIFRKTISHFKSDKGLLITPIQAHIIKYLVDNEYVYQRDLEKIFEFRRSTILGILKTMEKNELIRRIDCLENPRLKKIIATQNGIEIGRKINEQIIKFEKMLISDINKEELKIFFEVIEKIKRNIEKESV